ncbi:MAG: hypothetical protein AAFY88_14455, partial [Acidobacteriota bacterium]
LSIPEPAPDVSEIAFGEVTGARPGDGVPSRPESLVAASVDAPASPSFPEARSFLDGLRDLEGVTPQPARGYWANTYLPGDARLRTLADRLDALEPTPHALARPASAPVEAPRRAALGLAIDADRRGLDGPGRLLVRVGLRATDRFAGRRASMNVALLLDLRAPLDAAAISAVRTALDAFIERAEIGDRFRLFVAGPGGGLVLDVDDFRHGPVRDFFEHRLPELSGDAASWVDVYAQALDAVAGDDDPSAPLGSSAVVVITPGALVDVDRAVELLAHRAAVAGIQTSVLDIAASEGDGVRRLALLGQGRLHAVGPGDDIHRVVDAELQSSTRTVARAVRLRIRLAAGVELLDVVGSHRLDEVRAERVRVAERSIDRRLARTLGLRADRGDDDEGIQILIPAFYAGDDHAVLLDVIAPGAGHVADVRVKFKDLVHLENGVVRARLDLDRGGAAPGQLERSVLASRLDVEVEDGLSIAADHLRHGRTAAAVDDLRRLRRLIAGVQQLAGLHNDPGLERDRRMITLFLAELEAEPGVTAPDLWADALRYAGLRKRLGVPLAL